MIGFGLPSEILVPKQSINPQPDGTFTISNLDGSVVSIQPDGSQQSRPSGTAGAYEKATRAGNLAFYFAGGDSKAIYTFAIVDTLPNG